MFGKVEGTLRVKLKEQGGGLKSKEETKVRGARRRKLEEVGAAVRKLI